MLRSYQLSYHMSISSPLRRVRQWPLARLQAQLEQLEQHRRLRPVELAPVAVISKEPPKYKQNMLQLTQPTNGPARAGF